MILSRPKEYLTRAFLPSFLSWLCKLAVIGIFLAAFAIPVTFESIMWVTGSGSLANVVSFTPGAVGITQATNALALDTCCDVANEHRGRLLDRAAADHDRLERPRRARARRLGLRLDGRQAARRRSPTPTRRARSPSRRPSAPRRRRRSEAEREESGRGRLRRRRDSEAASTPLRRQKNLMASGPSRPTASPRPGSPSARVCGCSRSSSRGSPPASP